MNAFLQSIGYQHWILPVLLAVPLVGALAIWLQGALGGRDAGSPEAVSQEGVTGASAAAHDARVAVDEVATGTASAPRMLALLTFGVEFVLSLGLWWAFDSTNAAWQFVVDTPWIPSWGVRFTLGVDGIAVMMVLLTTFIMFLASLGSWTYIRQRAHAYYALLLILTTGMLGAFVALDLFLFYVMWEVMLVPMYFIVGIWGGERRIYARIGEYRQYNQIIPWTDREDYLNSPGNNVAFVLGCERLFGVEITPRCTVLRVIAMELSRMISHLVWLGTTCIDLGAFTPFLWAFQERENVYHLLENWVGARLTTTLTRVGGMAADIPDGWLDGLAAFIRRFPKTLGEIDRVVTRNGIWVGRTVGLGVMSPEEAVNYGLSGPMVRASGVAYDVRKDFPYLDYETYDFDVPVGQNGDVYDRYLVRMEELRQSVRILEQALKRVPDGPVNSSDHRVILPPKSKATSDMESMIHHFKQVMEGPRPPIGEVYVPVESPKGEKGYYMVSDGTSKPVRWRIRPPSFVNLSAIPRMVEGHLLSDVIAINASIDIVMGEIDR